MKGCETRLLRGELPCIQIPVGVLRSIAPAEHRGDCAVQVPPGAARGEAEGHSGITPYPPDLCPCHGCWRPTVRRCTLQAAQDRLLALGQQAPHLAFVGHRGDEGLGGGNGGQCDPYIRT